MTDYRNSPSAVAQWLDTHRDQFYSELAERLDIEAGLEEVLLAERHTGLVEGLHDRLDIEGGLAAILPPPPAPLPEATNEPHTPGSLEWASYELARMPLSVRLELRADYADKLGFAAREASRLLCPPIDLDQLDAACTRIMSLLGGEDPFERNPPKKWIVGTRATEMDNQKQEQLELFLPLPGSQKPEQLELPLPDDDDQDNNPDIDIVWHVGHGVGKTYLAFAEELRRTVVFDNLPPISMSEWKAEVARYVQSSILRTGLLDKMVSEGAPGGVEGPAVDLASYLAFLEQMLNDFIGADLREVELAGMPLEGLRWSEQTTQWPDRWREQIKQDSVHIEGDVYEVHYGTHTRGRNTMV